MFPFFRLSFLSSILLSAGLLLSGPAARAQTAAPAGAAAARGYDFLTVTTMESASKNYAKILITPSFQGKSEVPLEDYHGLGIEKYFDKVARNTQLINQQLSDLTAAGWELVETHVAPFIPMSPAATRYLFRKAKP